MRLPRSTFPARVRRLLGLALLVAAASPLCAQTPADARDQVFAGSELEEYLRLLQAAGAVPLHPWSLRGFTPAQVDRLAADLPDHPWAARYRLGPDTARGPRLVPVEPRVGFVFHSALPRGANDGAVWAGRGITAAAEGGFSARWGPATVIVAPVAFVAQNRGFDLLPNGYEGEQAYRDGRYPWTIDLPQRFGDEPYARVDPGQSGAHLDLGPVALGVSSANQWWGPAGRYPLLLGNNAPGFPHAYLGTARPLNVGLGRFHGRVTWGRLSQTGYASTSPGQKRLMTGYALAFTPRGLDGLELGVARFFHSPWPQGGLEAGDLLRPFESFYKKTVEDDVGVDDPSHADNQLASVFARWVFAPAGLEVYAEYGREDHNWDLRDFLLEPENTRAYLFGVRRAWLRGAERADALRFEVASSAPSNIQMARYQGQFYGHALQRQGHTHRGQLLGSPAVYDGTGAVLGWDRYTPRGRLSVQGERRTRYVRGIASEFGATDDAAAYTLGAEAVLFRGRYDFQAGLAATYDRGLDGGAGFGTSATLQLRGRL